MTRRLCAALALACGLWAAACSQAPVAEEHASGGAGAPAHDGKLVLTGSGAVAPLAAEIAHRFEKVYPGVRVEVRTDGGGNGLHALRAGVAHIGMVARPLYDSEKDLTGFALARDAVGLIVHAANRVLPLSDEEVIAIYTGAVTDWSQLGGISGPITVVHAAAGRPAHELFLNYYGLKDGDIRAQVVTRDNAQGVRAVAGDPLAIGYVSVGAAEQQMDAGMPIRLLRVGGVQASTAAVREGRFPLSRQLALVTTGPPQGLAKEFIAFATSERVRDLLEARSLVPVVSDGGN
ncbi:MAG: phosphate ABC transporter substrate-binding protein [Nitrospirota bacterium]|nr:phosphate ABC transporter substrate-binding protein [Nitrospirota bacterium]